MTGEQKNKILQVIDERINDIMDKMALITDQRMIGMITWKEYEDKRNILAAGRTALELEKKILIEEKWLQKN